MQRYTGGRACLAMDPKLQQRKRSAATGSGAAAAAALVGREDSQTLDGIMDAMGRVDAMLHSCEVGRFMQCIPRPTTTSPTSVVVVTTTGMTLLMFETEASEETRRSAILEEEQMAIRRMFMV